MANSRFHADDKNRVIHTFENDNGETRTSWLCKAYTVIDPRKIANALNQRETLLKLCKEYVSKADEGDLIKGVTYDKMKAAIGDNQ